MSRSPRVGDKVFLPSGKRVKVTVEAATGRPWAAVQTGWLWHVCRNHGRQGEPLVSLYFDQGRRAPIQLDEVDAIALAALLNRVEP